MRMHEARGNTILVLPAITSAFNVRRLTSGAGQNPVRAVLKGVVASQRQSPTQEQIGKTHAATVELTQLEFDSG